MKHQVRNKKNARKDHLQGSAWTRLAHPNLIPHPHASPLPPQKWPTPQSSPKTLNERTREKKAGASALFNKISTLQPLPIFFFSGNLSPLFWHLSIYIYIFLKQTGRLLLHWRRVDSTCVNYELKSLFCVRVQPCEWVAISKRPIFVVLHPIQVRQGCAQERKIAGHQ